MIIIHQINKRTNATDCLFLLGALCQSHKGEGRKFFSWNGPGFRICKLTKPSLKNSQKLPNWFIQKEKGW